MANFTFFPLKMGSTGKAVQLVQLAVGISPSGIYNAATANAVKSKIGAPEISAIQFLSIFTGLGLIDIHYNFPLLLNVNNSFTKDLQILLGISPTGNFDMMTEQALIKATGKDQLTYENFVNLICNTLGIKKPN